jgi:hypothetical protein
MHIFLFFILFMNIQVPIKMLHVDVIQTECIHQQYATAITFHTLFSDDSWTHARSKRPYVLCKLSNWTFRTWMIWEMVGVRGGVLVMKKD